MKRRTRRFGAIMAAWTALFSVAAGSSQAESGRAAEESGFQMSIQRGTQFNYGELGIGAGFAGSGVYLDAQGRRKRGLYASLSISIEGKPKLFQQPDLGEGESVAVGPYRIAVEKVLPAGRGFVIVRVWDLRKASSKKSGP